MMASKVSRFVFSVNTNESGDTVAVVGSMICNSLLTKRVGNAGEVEMAVGAISSREAKSAAIVRSAKLAICATALVVIPTGMVIVHCDDAERVPLSTVIAILADAVPLLVPTALSTSDPHPLSNVLTDDGKVKPGSTSITLSAALRATFNEKMVEIEEVLAVIAVEIINSVYVNSDVTIL